MGLSRTNRFKDTEMCGGHVAQGAGTLHEDVGHRVSPGTEPGQPDGLHRRVPEPAHGNRLGCSVSFPSQESLWCDFVPSPPSHTGCGIGTQGGGCASPRDPDSWAGAVTGSGHHCRPSPRGVHAREVGCGIWRQSGIMCQGLLLHIAAPVLLVATETWFSAWPRDNQR